jgi:hypothetical protein
MAKYKVLERSYLNDKLVEAGETVVYDGEPGKALELVEETPKAAAGDAGEGDGKKKAKGPKAAAGE